MRTTTPLSDLCLLIARLLVVPIFATSAIAKFRDWGGNVDYINSHHMPLPVLALGIALVIEAAGSACLIAGFQTKAVAALMFGYMVVLTPAFHRFGSNDFEKNLGITAALLLLTITGAGRWSLDHMTRSTSVA